MKLNNSLLLIAIAIIIMASSCVSRKKLTYLQYSGKSIDSEYITGEARGSVTPANYKIMPYDNLFIRIVTPDPQWSALFNQQTGEGGITMEGAILAGYPVDLDGNIEIPYVGKLRVAGKTLYEIKADLEVALVSYVTDAAISVRMVDNSVSVLGEVLSPGRYPITKDRMNIFEVIAMAGDMTVYSNRQKVQLIRPSAYGPVIKELTLSDRSILSSEYYYVMPNDIIYAMPMRGRIFAANSSVFTIFLTSITTALVAIGFFRTL